MLKPGSFANVVSSVALFVALGGTSYAALKLPKDSVGTKQIRKGAVDTAELHYRSVTPDKLGTDALLPRHVSPRLQRYLEGEVRAGPPGPAGEDAFTYRATIDAAGNRQGGNAVRVDHARGSNTYRVAFSESVGYCTPIATPVMLGAPGESFVPGARSIVISSYGSEEVEISTYGADGTPSEDGFNLIVAC